MDIVLRFALRQVIPFIHSKNIDLRFKARAEVKRDIRALHAHRYEGK